MTFPSYLEMPERVPRRIWQVLRFCVLAGAVAVVVDLLVDPSQGLRTVWKVVIPTLPAIFFIAPGLWRNLCPLATMNQLPRLTGRTRGLALPAWGHRFAYLIGIGAFLALVPMRKPLLE